MYFFCFHTFLLYVAIIGGYVTLHRTALIRLLNREHVDQLLGRAVPLSVGDDDTGSNFSAKLVHLSLSNTGNAAPSNRAHAWGWSITRTASNCQLYFN